jgi:hypothetical protein
MRLRLLYTILPLAFAVPAPAAPLTSAAMQEDLRFLREVWSHTDRSLDDEERREFDAVVDAALARAETLTPADFALEVSRAVATAHNGHSAANIGAFLHGMPVGFAWFADGLFIVRAEPPHRDLLGARVEKLGALSPEAARTRTAALIPGNEALVRSESAVMLRMLEVLHYIGATRNRNSAVLQLRLRDGSARKVTLGVEQSPDPAKQPAWMGLVPAARDVPGRWEHVLDSVTQIPSLYSSVTNLHREWWQDDRVFYLRSNYVWGTDQNRYELFDNLIGVLQVEVAVRRPKYAIVDLRLNRGGDFFNTINFAQALPKLIPPDGRVYVLVGPDTFSAAIVTAAMLKDGGGERVMLVGDTVGDDAEFWSEGRGVKLPQSGITVSTASWKHNWEKACTDPTVCYWANTAFGPKGISLQPTLRVPVRFADYAAGRDPVLEAVLNDAR